MLPSRNETIKHLLQGALAESGTELGITDLTDELSLQDDLGLDSFQLMQVSRHIEEAYDLRFTLVDWVLDEQDLDTGKAFTIGSLTAYITRHMADDGQPA